MALAASPALAALAPDELFERISPSVWGVVALRDRKRDLCQLKVANFNAPAVPIANVDTLRVGGRVYAVGNPRGLENTLSEGIVSGLRRNKNGDLEVIQTTAPISPGSSGGGLFDLEGRLIGITTFGIKEGQNLNFAVPAEPVRDMAARLAMPQRLAEGSRAPGGRYGDTWEYVVTELTTQQQRTVGWRVERTEGDRVVYNQGTRIENAGGEVLSVKQALAGELDQATPPNGWQPREFRSGARWSMSYTTEMQQAASYEVTAEVLGAETVSTPAGDFNTIVVRHRGYVARGTQGSITVRGTFEATVWYSEDLKRPVRFEVESRSDRLMGPYGFLIRERAELVRRADL